VASLVGADALPGHVVHGVLSAPKLSDLACLARRLEEPAPLGDAALSPRFANGRHGSLAQLAPKPDGVVPQHFAGAPTSSICARRPADANSG